MEGTEQKSIDFIQAYLEASPEERQLMQLTAACGASAEHVREDISLAVMLGAVSELGKTPPNDEVLAWFVSLRLLGVDRQSPDVLAAERRIERWIEEDPELLSKIDAFEARMRALDRSSDAVAQFEMLTGRKLGAEAKRVDRVAVARRRQGLSRWQVTALSVVLLIGALIAADSATRSPVQELAFDYASAEAELLQTRSAPGSETSGEALYLSAFRDLVSARETTIGLFPRYSESDLISADDKLERIISRSADPHLIEEARYLLGLVRLAQGTVADARALFMLIQESGGFRAAHAQKILTELEDNG